MYEEESGVIAKQLRAYGCFVDEALQEWIEIIDTINQKIIPFAF
jgi:hypothetical protein